MKPQTACPLNYGITTLSKKKTFYVATWFGQNAGRDAHKAINSGFCCTSGAHAKPQAAYSFLPVI
jgi:hypothetical protein